MQGKIYFTTFGCKVNQYETECIAADFVRLGMTVTDAPSEADVIVVNSCTVTASGDSKSLYAVRKLRKINPHAVIVLTGCLPQADPQIEARIPEADIITGTRLRSRIPPLVQQFLSDRQRNSEIAEYGRHDEFEIASCGEMTGRTRAFVKIQDGCNQFCSYCIIPYSRGRCRSKPIDSLKSEIEGLAAAGHKEIVLVGINLAFYGTEFGLRLADAVEVCCGVNGIERVRLGSLEPEMINDDDLMRLAKLPQFCPQFHLSLQSGCDRTLKAMNRHYDTAQYLNLADRIRRIFPDCALTTDMMVGFPDETDGDFAQSLLFAEKIGFAKIHVFQYSPRHGTPAARMKQIPQKVKAERAERLKSLGASLHENYMKKLIGKTVPVLFERENCTEFHQGYAPDYTLVKIPRKNSKKSLRNMIFCVKIESSMSDYCLGTVQDIIY